MRLDSERQVIPLAQIPHTIQMTRAHIASVLTHASEGTGAVFYPDTLRAYAGLLEILADTLEYYLNPEKVS